MWISAINFIFQKCYSIFKNLKFSLSTGTWVIYRVPDTSRKWKNETTVNTENKYNTAYAE